MIVWSYRKSVLPAKSFNPALIFNDIFLKRIEPKLKILTGGLKIELLVLKLLGKLLMVLGIPAKRIGCFPILVKRSPELRTPRFSKRAMQ